VKRRVDKERALLRKAEKTKWNIANLPGDTNKISETCAESGVLTGKLAERVGVFGLTRI
jgi:hypothetical protein